MRWRAVRSSADVTKARQTSKVIVLTAVQDSNTNSDPRWDELIAAAALPGFRLEVVAQGPAQLRLILMIDGRAVVLWAGPGNAVVHATELIEELRRRARPTVIAIAQAHGESTESRFRRTGAIYLCGKEAHERLGDVLAASLYSKFPVGQPGWSCSSSLGSDEFYVRSN
jgi:hypothetical protein